MKTSKAEPEKGARVAGELPVAPAVRTQGPAEMALRDCFQCLKCSAGCSVATVTDLLPHEVVQAIRLGQVDRVLASHFLWLCIGCQTCVTRCPNRVDLPSTIDVLRASALAAGTPAAEPQMVAFHRAFLSVVRRRGRSHELSLIGRYKLATRKFFQDLGLGLRLFRRGKIRLLGSRIAGRAEVRAMFDRPKQEA